MFPVDFKGGMRTTQLCPPTGGRCNGVTLGRATSPTQLWRADPEGANCRQLFAVLRRVSLINEISLLSQLNCLLLNWGKSPQFFFLFFWIWDMERLKRLAEAALVSSLSLPNPCCVYVFWVPSSAALSSLLFLPRLLGEIKASVCAGRSLPSHLPLPRDAHAANREFGASTKPAK